MSQPQPPTADYLIQLAQKNQKELAEQETLVKELKRTVDHLEAQASKNPKALEALLKLEKIAKENWGATQQHLTESLSRMQQYIKEQAPETLQKALASQTLTIAQQPKEKSSFSVNKKTIRRSFI